MAQGTMSRAQMEEIIRSNRSVTLRGHLYERIEDLPSEATLLEGNPAAATEALTGLQEQMATLQRQMADLQAVASLAPASAETNATAPAALNQDTATAGVVAPSAPDASAGSAEQPTPPDAGSAPSPDSGGAGKKGA